MSVTFGQHFRKPPKKVELVFPSPAARLALPNPVAPVPVLPCEYRSMLKEYLRVAREGYNRPRELKGKRLDLWGALVLRGLSGEEASRAVATYYDAR